MELSYEPLYRVIHVSFGLDVGGQEKLLVEFARNARRESFDLQFVSLGQRGMLAGDIEALDWPVAAMGVPSGIHFSLMLRLVRLFHERKPDVVHTHDQRALFYAGPAARLARVPMIVHTRHGRDIHATKRQTAIFRHLSKLVDRFVCVSEEVAALSLSQGMNRTTLRTIRNGIDTRAFRHTGPDPDGAVVTVARLSPEKDVANLVRATAIAAIRAPALRVEIAGGGSCLEELQGLAASLGVADRIAFLGEVRNIPAVLGGSRMFVLPSRSEGIPLTALEAMAWGLPVVATRVGGLPEVVEQGVTGLLVPPADPTALADAMVAVWSSPELRDRMGRAGRQRAEEYFDVRRMVAQYEDLYTEAGGVRRQRECRAQPVSPAQVATAVKGRP